MIRSLRSTQVFSFGVLLALVVGLLLALPMLRPPPADLIELATFLGISAAVSLLVGLVTWRARLWQRTSIRTSLTLGYLIAGGLAFFNVWLTAQLMFINQEHDLALAELLLIFSGLLMIAFGYLASSSVIERAAALAAAARKIAGGDLSTRLNVVGGDELASAAESFNLMAAELETIDRKQKELEALRRDLIAWTSHDLRTPLTAIRVRAEALADGVVEEEQTVRRYHGEILSEVRRMGALIDDLYELARLDAGGQQFDIELYSLRDLVSDTLESFRLDADKKKIRLSGKTDPDLDPVMMDAQKMSRLLSNLVANAIRHTASGGEVTLRAERDAHKVVMQVADTGEGIAEVDLPRVFERFFRGERSRNRRQGGTGLGLAIARGIAEGHAGKLTVESEIGVGTEFTIRWRG